MKVKTCLPRSLGDGPTRNFWELRLLAPACLGCTRASYCDFLAIWKASFFGCFLKSILEASWLGFPAQLAFQKPPKSMKYRCQAACCLGPRFLNDFSSIFPPRIHQNRLTNRFRDASILWSLLTPIFHRFWLDFRSQLGAMLDPRAPQNSLPRGNLSALRSLTAPKNPLEALRKPPETLQDAPGLDFGWIFKLILGR